MQTDLTPSPALHLHGRIKTLNHWAGSIFTALVIVTGVLGYEILPVHATAGQILKVVTSDGGSTFYIGRCFRTDLKVQTDSLNANSVDVILMYNSSYLQPYTSSGCTIAATAIQTDGLFGSHPANTIGGGLVEVTGYDATGTNPVNTGAAPTDRLLGHIYWKVMAASGAYFLPFQFTLGSTIDTNMAQQNGDGSDVLDAVENLTIALAADAIGPTFTSLSPSSGATGVSVTTGVTYTFSDAGAGVATGTLVHTLNGTTKSKTFSGCTRTNSNRIPSCNVTMSSVGTLSYNTFYRVSATGSDLASPSANESNTVWTFTTEDDTDAPYITGFTPTNGSSGVAVNSNIVFHVKDYKANAGVTAGLGVAISTVSVTVTPASGAPITYTSASAQFGYTGTSADYTITINPTADFAQNTLISVTIDASDQHVAPNVMSQQSFSFTTTDSTAPIIGTYVPAQNATGVSPDANVTFHITDGGAGVSISNTTVVVNGTSYTSASPQFSYTGTSSDYAVTINPSSNFSGGATISVSITTQDLATTPNTATSSYSFTIENSCSTCSVDTEDPARFSTTATLDTTLSFHVKDTGVGILSSSITMTLSGNGAAMPTSPLTITGASAMVAITGTSADYAVTITLPAAIEANVAYSLLIEATDTDGRSMSPVGYTFMNQAFTTTTTTVVSNTCSSTATVSTTGGNSRRTTSLLADIKPADLPMILARKRLPGSNTVVTEQLSAEDARSVRVCYVDDLPVHAAAPGKTSYSDVPAGAWYESAVKAFLDLGILDASQPRFRPNDSSARAELAKVLGKLHGRIPDALPAILHFDDVPRVQWYAPFVEFAGEKGWMRGYQNCIGTHPCRVMPGATISRAEAVAMLIRFYELKATGTAPAFTDIDPEAWYAKDLATAADHCVLQGIGGTHRAAPSQPLTRAEMIVLLDRARHNLSYGMDCGDPDVRSSADMQTSSVMSGGAASSVQSEISSSSAPASSSASVPASEASASASSSSTATSSLSSVMTSSASSVGSAHAAATPSESNGTLTATLILIGAIGIGLLTRLATTVVAGSL